ncbi:MAG TPA: amidohydrolase [Vicinamibacterales bacterium]|nr:amidohydrolase [Vicinamibacterales bacterium]
MRRACHALLFFTALASAVGFAARAPERAALVVTGGVVVTMDGGRRVLDPGALAVRDGEILAVDRPEAIAARFQADETIDARGQIVLPGLVNAHTHAAMVLFRGLADDLALMEWLERYIFPAEAKAVTPAFVRVGTRLAALEMIESGTTAFADMYYFEEEVARAAREAGLRAVAGETIIRFPSPDAKTPQEALARAERFIREWRGDALIVPAVAPHALYTLDAPELKASRALADRYAVPLLLHVAETEDEVRIVRKQFGAASPVAYLEGLGVLGPRTLAAHGVHVTAEDIAILRRRAVGVAHNPESNMKLASGVAPVPALRQADVTVALGTDGAASNNDLDMFEAMRQAALLHKLVARDPRVLPAPAVLEMATLGGARALGLADRVGSLEPGKRADLILVSTASARLTPLYDPVSHLVYVAKGTDVTTTIVDGTVLMRDRRVATLDARAVLAEARAMAETVRAALR